MGLGGGQSRVLNYLIRLKWGIKQALYPIIFLKGPTSREYFWAAKAFNTIQYWGVYP